MLQLLVYAVLARQGTAVGRTCVWVGLVALVAAGLTASTLDALLDRGACVDAVLLVALAASACCC